MRRLPSALLLAAIAAVGSIAAAVAQPIDPAQTERIRLARHQIESRHQAAVAACATVFASTACVDRARTERREALDRLRHEELVLDDARRRERAARRLEAIESKTSAADARQAVEPPPPRAPKAAPAHGAPRTRAAVGTADAASASVAASAATAGHRTRSSMVLREADAARAERAAQAERRRQDAQDHRDKVLERNAARDRTRPPAAPLPVPPAAGASSSPLSASAPAQR